jgi:hypothetical protein
MCLHLEGLNILPYMFSRTTCHTEPGIGNKKVYYPCEFWYQFLVFEPQFSSLSSGWIIARAGLFQIQLMDKINSLDEVKMQATRSCCYTNYFYYCYL